MNALNYLQVNVTETPDASVFESVLSNPAIPEQDKEKLKAFLTGLGYKVNAYDDTVKVYIGTKVYNTWEIRAKSKELIAFKDLNAICNTYEGKDVEDAYTPYEIHEILEKAKAHPYYAENRRTAVMDAYVRFALGRRAVDVCTSEEKEEEQTPEEENQENKN